MSLYDIFFGEYGIGVSQILVTDADFSNRESRDAFRGTCEHLLKLGIGTVVLLTGCASALADPACDAPSACVE